jgi:hypothetical protein
MTATTVSSRTTPRLNRPSAPAWPSRLVNRHSAVRSGGGQRGRMLERGPSLRPSARGPKRGQPASSALISSPADGQPSTARPVGVGFSTNRPALLPEVGTRAGPFVLHPAALAVAGSRWRSLLERVPKVGPEVLFLGRGFLGGRQTRGLLLVGYCGGRRRLRSGGDRGGRRSH